MLQQLRTSVLMLLVMALLAGLVYPLTITGISQLAFHRQANGSLILENGKPVGSALIGQPFDDPKYFWSRPSATTPFPYNAAASSGSNLAVSNPAQVDAITQRVQRLRASGIPVDQAIPPDLLTASGSGLDPDISVASAEAQAARIAKTRGISNDQVLALIHAVAKGRVMGFLGEPRVNVLRLNLDLDSRYPK
jgi:K+-transporting ATPase ATPase C chain